MHGGHVHILHHTLLLGHLRLDVIIYLAQETVHLIRQCMVATPQCTEEAHVEILTFLRLQSYIGIDSGTVTQQFTSQGQTHTVFIAGLQGQWLYWLHFDADTTT